MKQEKMEKILVQSRPFLQSVELLEDLHGAGYAIVPIHPTPAMLEAGAWTAELSTATVARIYRATLLAAGQRAGENL
ncbi:MAG: hypothetical protein HY053_03090 [Proteobacteria bacterium]|nr:hypothetical protein [Pseudomonadota bacterium]